MRNLKQLFRSNPCLLSVSKAEKELLECFVANKAEFDHWLVRRPQQRVRFYFYFPTAIDFYFDGFLLFTAYFKKTASGTIQLHEFKMTQTNYSTICSSNWKPFAEVIEHFLRDLEEKNKISYFRQTSSLHEYVSICENGAPASNSSPAGDINPSLAAG